MRKARAISATINASARYASRVPNRQTAVQGVTQPVLNSLTAAGYKLICFDHADKIVEEIAAVVRARCTLGMVLHTECRLAF